MGEFSLSLGMAGNSPGVGGAPEINEEGKAPLFGRGSAQKVSANFKTVFFKYLRYRF